MVNSNNGNNRTFRQYILAQFISKNFKKDTIKENYLNKLSKILNASKIPFSIPLRLSKKVLEKLEFYKGKRN